ncbi:MAG TPA: homoserine kinase [Methanomicrobia archaeon]|nr:homoserine kinase [Methanomicrobia archaeon]
MNTYVKVRAPATLANFGPGFDVYGVALEEPFDTVEISLTDGPSTVTSNMDSLPTDVNENVASYAAQQVLDRYCAGVHFDMRVTKGIRPASGMGSSGASSVAGAFAAAALCDKIVAEDIVLAAAEGERISSGNPHADNVVPSYLGGFTSIVSLHPFNVINIHPTDLHIVAVLPDIEVSTRQARAILPDKVALQDAVSNVAMGSYVIYCLMNGDYEGLSVALDDKLSVPYRKALINGYDEARQAALDAGALAFSLGGSGPTVFAVTTNTHKKEIADAIANAFADKGIGSSTYLTMVGSGAQVVALE